MSNKPKFDPKKHTQYYVQNPEKYIGKSPPICRSNWEYSVCKYFDTNPSVIEWASEPFSIPYFDPTTQKKRRYFPDFLAKIVNSNNEIDTWLIEVKPNKETKPPRNTKQKSNKTYIWEQKAYKINSAKWKSAMKVCERKGWKFKILTEKTIMKS